MSTKEKTSEEVLLNEDLLKQNEIVLFNDDVNTFDHVIDRNSPLPTRLFLGLD